MYSHAANIKLAWNSEHGRGGI